MSPLSSSKLAIWPTKHAKRPDRIPRFRPRLERLEERTLLSPVPFAIFGTGQDNSGVPLPGGDIDPHYVLTNSADPNSPGPNTYVLQTGPPISPNGPWVANGPTSKWISVQPNNAGNAAPGNYTYETTFDLTGFDPHTATVLGAWAAGGQGFQILLNGHPVVAGNSGPTAFTPFTINTGFVAGVNKLDFFVENFAAGPTGLRVELSGTADAAPVLTSLVASPGTIDEGGTTTLNGTFAEAGPPLAHTVVINWGPGQSNTTLALAAGVNTFSSAHLYPDNLPGNAPYPVEATVSDSVGEAGSGGTRVTVNNVAPSNIQVSLTPTTVHVGDTVTLTGSFTDPGVLDTHTVNIDWGDGQNPTTLNLPAGVLTFSATHPYLSQAPAGSGFLVEVSVDDNDPLVATGPPSASNFQFRQLNWYGSNPLLQVPVLQVPNSSWGEVEANVVGDPNQPDYLNIVADAGNGPAWIIQNMPIFGDLTDEAAYFDITQLGLREGTRLRSLSFISSVDTVPQTTAPSGPMTTVSVAALAEMISCDGGSGKDPPGGVGKPSPFKVPGDAPSTNVIEHDDVPGVNEEKDQCMNGAFARSLIYLFDKNGKPLTKGDLDPKAENPTQPATGQDAYEAFKARLGGPEKGDPSRVNIKAKFLDDLAQKKGLKGQTVAFDPNNNLGTLSNVTKTTETNFLTWVRDQLKKGEDVELSWLWPGDSGSHIITIVGIYDSGGMTYLKYRDDGPQGTNGQHNDTGAKVDGKLTTDKDGNYLFMGHAIKFAISESLGQAVVTPLPPVKKTPTPNGRGPTQSIPAGVPPGFESSFSNPGAEVRQATTVAAGMSLPPASGTIDIFSQLDRLLRDEFLRALDLSLFINAPDLALSNPELVGQIEQSNSTLNADLQADDYFQTDLGRVMAFEALAFDLSALTSHEVAPR